MSDATRPVGQTPEDESGGGVGVAEERAPQVEAEGEMIETDEAEAAEPAEAAEAAAMVEPNAGDESAAATPATADQRPAEGESSIAEESATSASAEAPHDSPATEEPAAVEEPTAPAAPRPSRGHSTSREEMEAALEAVLFVAAEPLPRDRLLELFDEGEREEAAGALQAVLDRYRDAGGRGIMAEEVGGGVRLVTRPELHGHLRRFFEISGRGRLSMAALETLAIIAYRQPLTGPEVAELRGVQSSAVIKTLLERRLIRIAGRKQVVGKPFLYATTREFLLHFGLGTLGDLPPLEEMEEFFAAEGGGEPAAPPDREEEVERAAAELDAREDSRSAPDEGADEDEG